MVGDWLNLVLVKTKIKYIESTIKKELDGLTVSWLAKCRQKPERKEIQSLMID